MSKIKVNAIVEIAGFPEEHIKKTMQEVIEKIKQLKGAKILSSETAPTNQNKQMFTTFTEFEIEFNNFESLLIFCFNFMPSSLEILEPSKFDLKLEELQDLMNSLLTKLHQYDLGVKKLFLENRALQNKLKSEQKK